MSKKLWKCAVCGDEALCDEQPSERFERVASVETGQKNVTKGVNNTDYQRSARHYGPVCFGPDRGEDYQCHSWHVVTARQLKKLIRDFEKLRDGPYSSKENCQERIDELRAFEKYVPRTDESREE